MAWNIGANDVANAMGTSVGSKALTLKKAVLFAAVLEFSGAFFVGSSVSGTIQNGIIETNIFQSEPMVFAVGMMGALIATGVSLQFASYFGLPISTTHAIVGAVAGFGVVIGGVDAIHWSALSWIVMSWILSPALSGVISFFVFRLIQRKILYTLNPSLAAKELAPYFVFICLFVVSLSMVYNGLNLDYSFSYASILATIPASIGAVLSRFAMHRKRELEPEFAGGFNPYQAVSIDKALKHLQRAHIANQNKAYSEDLHVALEKVKILSAEVKKQTPYLNSTHHYHEVEKIFVLLQIISACLVAFAHGANDVANAIGPVAAVIEVFKTQSIQASASIPSWLLAMGGVGIVIGLATWGFRVIETIGKKITELTPTRGFSAEFGAATTILIASKLGLPISTTHALIGSVLGVGMARGLRAINL